LQQQHQVVAVAGQAGWAPCEAVGAWLAWAAAAVARLLLAVLRACLVLAG
jgi:hypothetical protein